MRKGGQDPEARHEPVIKGTGFTDKTGSFGSSKH